MPRIYNRFRDAYELRFPASRSLVRVGPGHRSTALCTFSRVLSVVVWYRLSLIKVQRKELACQEYLQELLVIVPEPRPREADGFSSVRYISFSLVFIDKCVNIHSFNCDSDDLVNCSNISDFLSIVPSFLTILSATIKVISRARLEFYALTMIVRTE